MRAKQESFYLQSDGGRNTNSCLLRKKLGFENIQGTRGLETTTMPEEASSKTNTAKSVVGFLAFLSLLILMGLAFKNNATIVRLTERQTSIAEKLKEVGGYFR